MRRLSLGLSRFAILSLVVGSVSALFLWSLDAVTLLRVAHPWLLFCLPLIGGGVGWLYHVAGQNVESGTNLILERIYKPDAFVPTRMAPLIFVATLLTHLGGGSAGREGTAVQMGGGVAGTLAKWFGMRRTELRLFLLCGVAAGFGAVFGTPFAGAIFAAEVLTVGRLELRALVPCLLAAGLADAVCRAWGVQHAHYLLNHHGDAPAQGIFGVDWVLFAKVLVAAVAFGLASACFVSLNERTGRLFARHIAYPPLRPFVGGMTVIALFFAVGTGDYLGLGVVSPRTGAVTISSFFDSSEWHPWSWIWKLLFTVVTLGSGFKGGEVTPLFFIGAALGHALSMPLNAPPDLLAALGFVSVFAAAAKTPLACAVMGVELFGIEYVTYLVAACFVAKCFGGRSGIYKSQRHPGAALEGAGACASQEARKSRSSR